MKKFLEESQYSSPPAYAALCHQKEGVSHLPSAHCCWIGLDIYSFTSTDEEVDLMDVRVQFL